MPAKSLDPHMLQGKRVLASKKWFSFEEISCSCAERVKYYLINEKKYKKESLLGVPCKSLLVEVDNELRTLLACQL